MNGQKPVWNTMKKFKPKKKHQITYSDGKPKSKVNDSKEAQTRRKALEEYDKRQQKEDYWDE